MYFIHLMVSMMIIINIKQWIFVFALHDYQQVVDIFGTGWASLVLFRFTLVFNYISFDYQQVGSYFWHGVGKGK